ncbi:MAG: leucyl aminopeptidase family protein [Nocardioidaceae bacterium]
MDDPVEPPDITATTDPLTSAFSTVLAVGFSCIEGSESNGNGNGDNGYLLDDRAYAVLTALGVDAFALLDRASATGSAGELVTHELFGPADVQTVVMVGLGDLTTRDIRRAGAALTRTVKGREGDTATSIGAHCDDEQLAGLVEGMLLGGFGYRLSGQDASAGGQPRTKMTLTDLPSHRHSVVSRSTAAAQASWRARTFALTPSNLKNPARLEKWAREAADAGGLTVEVWDDARLAAEGFGGILAVGAGSEYESRFIRLDYSPDAERRAAVTGTDERHTPHVVIVGKGITFDSGGISIKPRDAMMTMKRDMTGAGVVIAVMAALRDLGVWVRVTGLVASAENAFGAASMRPGDVVRHFGGRTSQVDNTDAEGRLVLADALAYAQEQIAADAVVDVATLTGAGKVAMGTSIGALFANDDGLAAALVQAGQASGEPVWRLPLYADYEERLDAPFADATNAAGGPGAITAALFLQHFAGETPWAHLDIASVGDSPKDAFEYTQGATGFGARLLLRWLNGF